MSTDIWGKPKPLPWYLQLYRAAGTAIRSPFPYVPGVFPARVAWEYLRNRPEPPQEYPYVGGVTAPPVGQQALRYVTGAPAMLISKLLLEPEEATEEEELFQRTGRGLELQRTLPKVREKIYNALPIITQAMASPLQIPSPIARIAGSKAAELGRRYPAVAGQALGSAGFLLDVLLDPTNFATAGLTHTPAIGKQVLDQAPEAVRAAVSAFPELAEVGVDVTKLSDDITQALVEKLPALDSALRKRSPQAAKSLRDDLARLLRQVDRGAPVMRGRGAPAERLREAFEKVTPPKQIPSPTTTPFPKREAAEVLRELAKKAKARVEQPPPLSTQLANTIVGNVQELMDSRLRWGLPFSDSRRTIRHIKPVHREAQTTTTIYDQEHKLAVEGLRESNVIKNLIENPQLSTMGMEAADEEAYLSREIVDSVATQLSSWQTNRGRLPRAIRWLYNAVSSRGEMPVRLEEPSKTIVARLAGRMRTRSNATKVLLGDLTSEEDKIVSDYLGRMIARVKQTHEVGIINQRTAEAEAAAGLWKQMDARLLQPGMEEALQSGFTPTRQVAEGDFIGFDLPGRLRYMMYRMGEKTDDSARIAWQASHPTAERLASLSAKDILEIHEAYTIDLSLLPPKTRKIVERAERLAYAYAEDWGHVNEVGRRIADRLGVPFEHIRDKGIGYEPIRRVPMTQHFDDTFAMPTMEEWNRTLEDIVREGGEDLPVNVPEGEAYTRRHQPLEFLSQFVRSTERLATQVGDFPLQVPIVNTASSLRRYYDWQVASMEYLDDLTQFAIQYGARRHPNIISDLLGWHPPIPTGRRLYGKTSELADTMRGLKELPLKEEDSILGIGDFLLPRGWHEWMRRNVAKTIFGREAAGEIRRPLRQLMSWPRAIALNSIPWQKANVYEQASNHAIATLGVLRPAEELAATRLTTWAFGRELLERVEEAGPGHVQEFIARHLRNFVEATLPEDSPMVSQLMEEVERNHERIIGIGPAAQLARGEVYAQWFGDAPLSIHTTNKRLRKLGDWATKVGQWKPVQQAKNVGEVVGNSIGKAIRTGVTIGGATEDFSRLRTYLTLRMMGVSEGDSIERLARSFVEYAPWAQSTMDSVFRDYFYFFTYMRRRADQFSRLAYEYPGLLYLPFNARMHYIHGAFPEEQHQLLMKGLPDYVRANPSYVPSKWKHLPFSLIADKIPVELRNNIMPTIQWRTPGLEVMGDIYADFGAPLTNQKTRGNFIRNIERRSNPFLRAGIEWARGNHREAVISLAGPLRRIYSWEHVLQDVYDLPKDEINRMRKKYGYNSRASSHNPIDALDATFKALEDYRTMLREAGWVVDFHFVPKLVADMSWKDLAKLNRSEWSQGREGFTPNERQLNEFEAELAGRGIEVTEQE